VALGRQPKFQAAKAAMQPVHSLKEPAVYATSSKPAPVPAAAYEARQMQLFSTFYGSGGGKPERLSNAIESLDLLPRFCVSRARMNSLRTADGHLPPIDHQVTIDSARYRVRVWPAQVEVGGNWLSYYPSAREEIVEHALRKLATLQHQGFYDQASHGTSHRSGVRFTLNQLSEELRKQGRSMTHGELTQSLDILSLSSLEITPIQGDDKKPEFYRSNYIRALGRRSLKEYRERGKSSEESTWLAEFHPLLASAIGAVGYRQSDYALFMKLPGQIHRYLYMRLVLKFTQASMLTTYDIRLSTIREDSCIFEGRTRLRDCAAEVEEAWKHLQELGVITKCECFHDKGPRNSILDVKYKVVAATAFINEQKAANRRRTDFLATGDRVALAQQV